MLFSVHVFFTVLLTPPHTLSTPHPPPARAVRYALSYVTIMYREDVVTRVTKMLRAASSESRCDACNRCRQGQVMKVAAAADVSELVLSTLRRKLSLAAGLEIRLKKEEKRKQFIKSES